MSKAMIKTKPIEKAKRNSMDLRKRSVIVVEPADIDRMSQAELMARINQLNVEINRSRRSNDLDFMINSPKIKALKQMREVLRERLMLK